MNCGRASIGIFQRRTGFVTLDRLLKRLHANKDELLMVLDHPEIPLHTNGSENDIRCQVTKRHVSGGTHSDIGRDCRDAFLALAKTCSKLGIAFWDYLGARLGVCWRPRRPPASRPHPLPRTARLTQQRPRGYAPITVFMVAAFEVIERLAGAGLHPARAVQHMRHLIDAGVVRRGPRGRPSSSRVEYTFDELASTLLGLAAQLPINAPLKARRLAEFIPEPGHVVEALFALPEHEPTLHAWLAAVLQRLAALPREQRKELYLTKPEVAPMLVLKDELTSPYPYADTAQFQCGRAQYIDFRPVEPPLRIVLEEPPRALQPDYIVTIRIGLLLDLTPPTARPENKDAATQPRAAASPIPAGAGQPLTSTAHRQPGLSNPRLSARESEGNNSSVELAGQLLFEETQHASRRRRRK